MSITVILGAQWGDEGKGRFTDALAHDANIVARFNGGDNAGHSITIGNQVVKLHMLPSGLFRAGCLSVIGNGCVVNPRNLLGEMADALLLSSARVEPAKLIQHGYKFKFPEMEPALKNAKPDDRYQFIRKGYFVLDKDSSGALVFNRTVGLKDGWKQQV